jgi:hypothetical protein
VLCSDQSDNHTYIEIRILKPCTKVTQHSIDFLRETSVLCLRPRQKSAIATKKKKKRKKKESQQCTSQFICQENAALQIISPFMFLSTCTGLIMV